MDHQSCDNNKLKGFASVCSTIFSGIISCFVFFLLMVFPLVTHDKYFDILETKYKTYYLSIIGMCVILLATALIMLFVDWKEYHGDHTKRLFSALLPSNWKTTFSLPDAAVLVFWLISALSTATSSYVYESFWGNEGRFSGLFLMTLYVVSYFIISRLWRCRDWYFQLFMLSGLVMSLWGISDYFNMDFLSFHKEMRASQIGDFTSTIGNINTYTAYIGMLMGFAAAMYVVEKNLWKRIWYYVCMIVYFFAILMGRSDNSYLSIGAMMIFLPYIAFHNMEGFRRYVMVFAGLLTVICCIIRINTQYANIVIGMDGAFKYFSKIPGFTLLVLLVWGGAVVLYIVSKKMDASKSVWGRKPLMSWTLFLAICFLAVVYVLYDANVAGHAERYAFAEKYLVFNDDWGTRRGYTWKASLRMYQEFSLREKLLGYGPDTFGILVYSKIIVEMVEKYGEYFDSAHNEYLQYLLTIGPIGVISYIVFLASSVRQMLKKSRNIPILAGAAFTVICYAFQAIVNINLPIVTPVLWLILSMGMAGLKTGTERGSDSRE